MLVIAKKDTHEYMTTTVHVFLYVTVLRKQIKSVCNISYDNEKLIELLIG